MERTTEHEVRAMFCALIDLGYDVALISDAWRIELRSKVPPFALVPQIYLATYHNGKQPHRSPA